MRRPRRRVVRTGGSDSHHFRRFRRSRRLPPVEHYVDHHTRKRDVEPDRKGYSGDRNMALETPPQPPDQGHDGKKRNRCRKNRVAEEDREVENAPATGALVAHASDLRVVKEIGNEKQGRGRESGEHAPAVRQPAATTNQKIARHQQRKAGAVEGGVDCRKLMNVQELRPYLLRKPDVVISLSLDV